MQTAHSIDTPAHPDQPSQFAQRDPCRRRAIVATVLAITIGILLIAAGLAIASG